MVASLATYSLVADAELAVSVLAAAVVVDRAAGVLSNRDDIIVDTARTGSDDEPWSERSTGGSSLRAAVLCRHHQPDTALTAVHTAAATRCGLRASFGVGVDRVGCVPWDGDFLRRC